MSINTTDPNTITEIRPRESSGNLTRLARGAWRLCQPLFQPGRQLLGQAVGLPRAYVRFARDVSRYRRLGGETRFEHLAPHMFDRNPSTQSGGDEYFYQDVWALRKLQELNPPIHHDFGSRLDGFVGQATVITEIVYWDIRRPSIELPGLALREGNLTELPIGDGEIASLSCLHTVEHVGLGRYGDPLDPLGTDRALCELQRVLSPGGRMLVSMPVGAPSVQFNAYRRLDPHYPIDQLSSLRLLEFSAIDAQGIFHADIPPEMMKGATSGCGLYLFRKD